MHDLDLHRFGLPEISEFFAGDDRALAFRVVDGDGNGVDISGATVEWALFRRQYEKRPASTPVLSGSDEGVELVTDDRVDTESGQWEVRLDDSASDGLVGEYWHRPRVIQSDESTASWRGRIILTQ